MNWNNITSIKSKEYKCGHCGNVVASNQGFFTNNQPHFIYICPHCTKPSYFYQNNQIPGIAPGNEIDHLPPDIEKLYREARNCVAVSSYTAAVLICRKLLMNIAVTQKAEEGNNFLFYVDYLADMGYVPPNGRGWVDHIRTKGNEANHEIIIMTQTDADELILFIEMLLKFIYEFPSKIPGQTTN